VQFSKHAGAFFGSKDDEWAAMLPFLREGSAFGTRTLLICDEGWRPALIRYLRGNGLDVASPDTSSQLGLRSWQELKGGEDPSGVTTNIGLMGRALMDNLASGIPATRVWCSMERLPVHISDAGSLIEYEDQFTDPAVQHGCNLICAYDLTEWGAPALLQIIAIHPMVLIGLRVEPNPFFRGRQASTFRREAHAELPRSQAEAELHSLNERLEQEVVSRTNALSQANANLQRASDLQRRADARLQELQSELLHAGRFSAMGQMAGALAHELGQPLGAIANYINAARRCLTNGGGDMLDLARLNIDDAASVVLRAGHIIERLREFVAGGEPEQHPENLADLIEEASSLALIGSAALGIDVSQDIAPQLPLALVDRIQIQQVIVNLIRNAIEAMANSERRELTLTASISSWTNVEISVADSGPGVPEHVAPRLFQPFISTKRQNMGLGLSICRSIVEEHGGQLWYESREGGGAVFRFTVPVVNLHDDVR
jgi:signal transduction histidine kinase